jgi:hypothetical protein
MEWRFGRLIPLVTFIELGGRGPRIGETIHGEDMALAIPRRGYWPITGPRAEKLPGFDRAQLILPFLKENSVISCNVASRMMKIAKPTCWHAVQDGRVLTSFAYDACRMGQMTVRRRNALFSRFNYRKYWRRLKMIIFII